MGSRSTTARGRSSPSRPRACPGEAPVPARPGARAHAAVHHRHARCGGAPNTPPQAVAGGDLRATVGETVSLDGSASADADGDTLTYRWSFASLPAGSVANLAGRDRALATFVPDLPGSYAVDLAVSDGVATAGDSVTVEAVAAADNRAPVADAATRPDDRPRRGRHPRCRRLHRPRRRCPHVRVGSHQRAGRQRRYAERWHGPHDPSRSRHCRNVRRVAHRQRRRGRRRHPGERAGARPVRGARARPPPTRVRMRWSTPAPR